MPPVTTKFRKHVTKACTQCRDSKIKCDGVSPVCSSCSRKGKDCRYEVREDRRKLSLRIAVDLLSARVQQLAQFIAEKGLEAPPMKQDDSTTLSGILQCLGIDIEAPPGSVNGGGGSSNKSPVSATAPQADTTVRAGQNQQSSSEAHGLPLPAAAQTDASERAEESPQAHHESHQQPKLGSIDIGAADSSLDFFNLDTSAVSAHSAASASSVFDSYDTEAETLNESEDELVKQLSDRVGTLHIKPGGHIRYLGSTSNFNLLETPGVDGVMNVHSRTVRNDGMDYLSSLGIGKEVPPDIEEHLVNLYFAWQDPAAHIVDRAIYESARIKWYNDVDTPYYSETLRNAICAAGAAFDTRYHPAFVTFPRSLADFFADRAKVLLELELDSSPTIATVQSLVILSAHDIGNGRDTRGWLFTGMAMRLTFVLGLHQDLTQYVAKGLLSQEEADLRQIVFWSACIVDHVWSFHLGQPFRFSLENATVEKPPLHPRKMGKWAPYVSSSLQSRSAIDCTSLVCRFQALLFEAMSPLSTTLYGSLSIPKTTLQQMNEQTVNNILEWKDTLPVELQVDPNNHTAAYLPHVLLMHMQFHQAIIYAHRPYMSKSYLQPSPPRGPGAGHARQMCIDSASAIAQILSLYETHYSLRRMNVQGVAITFSAALILIFVTISRLPAGNHDILGHLGTCFRALDELGSTWESAKRARVFIVRIQRHWETQAKLTRRPGRSSFGSFGSFSKPKSPSFSFKKSARPARSMLTESENDSYGSICTGSSLSFPAASAPPTGSGTAGTLLPGSGDEVFDGLDLSMDLDLDWMLTADLQGRPENWGSLFAVPSGDNILPPRHP